MLFYVNQRQRTELVAARNSPRPARGGSRRSSPNCSACALADEMVAIAGLCRQIHHVDEVVLLPAELSIGELLVQHLPEKS